MTRPDGPEPFTTLIDGDMKLYCAWEDAPSAADVAALEERLGRRLPPAYREFLEKYGGVMLEVREDAWPRPQQGTTGSAWMFQYAFLVFGIGEGIPRWLNIESVAAEFHRDNPEAGDLLPFFRWIMADDRLCFGKDHAIYEWSPSDPDKPRLIDKPFDEVILDVTRALVECKAKMKERGSQ